MGNRWGVNDAMISDGASNTLAISEVLGYDSEQDARGVWVMAAPGSSTFTARTRPNARGNNSGNVDDYDHISICDDSIPTSNILHCIQDYRTDGELWAAARSDHPGGVNASLCDGSVRFVTDSVDKTIWQAAATRAGGESEKLPE